MANIVEEFEREQIVLSLAGRSVPPFNSGDVLKVEYSSNLGDNIERVQVFEGLCIKRRNRGFASSFVLRKLSHHGVHVEKYFPVYSPAIKNITVVRRGAVRRAKLYYIRNLSGKASRIKEKVVHSLKASE